MKEIFESYRTTELRSFITAHNKKVRKIVREELKGIRQNILKKRLIDIKRKKREEIIEIMLQNKRFFKNIKKKPEMPKKDIDFILDKILQPKLTEAYNNYSKDRDQDELEDAVAEIRKLARNNGVKAFQTKAKMIKMIIDDVPPPSPKKKAPAKPKDPPKFIYDPKLKLLVLRDPPPRPERPKRKAPTLKEVRQEKERAKFDPAEVHSMPGGGFMTGLEHNENSRPLTEKEVQRVKAFRKEQKKEIERQQDQKAREREEEEKKRKTKEATKKIRDPKKRAILLRKIRKRVKVAGEKLEKVLALDAPFTKREQAYLDDLEDRIQDENADEKDTTRLGRLLKKYQDVEKQEGGKKSAPKKKKPPSKVIKEFDVDKKTAELALKALPPEEDFNKEDQADLYDNMLEKYIDIILGRDKLEEIKEDESFDKSEYPLFEYMVKNNLFTDKDGLLKEARQVLKEREQIKKELAEKD